MFATFLENSSRELLVGKVKMRIAGQCQCCRLNGKAAAAEQDWAASHAGMPRQQHILQDQGMQEIICMREGLIEFLKISVQFGNDVIGGMW